MSEHTPTPWKMVPCPFEWQHPVPCKTFRIDGPPNTDGLFAEEDAKFIVRACNSHDDLLAALERSAEAAHALTGDPTCEGHLLRECPTSYCAKAIAAIDKAKG